jgi:hypothetical protein
MKSFNKFNENITKAHIALRGTLFASLFLLIASITTVYFSIRFPQINYLTNVGYILGILGVLSIVASLIIGKVALDYTSKFVKKNEEE